MHLTALSYVGIRSKNLDDWADYGSRFLGMQLLDKSRGTLALRMDDRKQRVIVQSGRGRGAGVLRLGSRRCGGTRRARRASGKIRREGRARLARARG